MSRASWKNKSWLRRFASQGRSAFNDPAPLHGLYPVPYFRQKLIQERRRAERSHKPLLVMILDAERLISAENTAQLTDSLGDGINTCLRSTDVCGLLTEALVGVILTEVEPEKVEIAKRRVASKTRDRLVAVLTDAVADRIGISFRIYPEAGGEGDAFDPTFFPEIGDPGKAGGEIMKRALDVVGSITGMLIFSPFFALLPVLIKLGSKGPVLFRQERIGRNGRKFKLLKFRSMYLDNDDRIHREYVKQLIAGAVSGAEGSGEKVFKIQADPRVTPVGRFIRKYSLDELPQFINVLKGEMSLVGPRPPIKYELEQYRGWQRNRLMGKRPGITGLWQVTARSSSTFDEMVRLDLRYLRHWSIALDLKILLRTPAAMFKCKGAY